MEAEGGEDANAHFVGEELAVSVTTKLEPLLLAMKADGL